MATATLRSHVSPRPLSLVKLRFRPLFLGAQKLRGGRKSAPLFWVLAFGRVLGASMVDVVRLSSLRFSSSPSSSSLTPSSSRQRGALCPPPHKLHRWSDASANCSHGGGVAGLGFGTQKRFASLKGIGDCTKLEFYLVTYDEIGGIACRRVGEPADRFSGCAPVFWTSKATFIEPPFSQEEVIMYDSCMHLHPIDEENSMFRELPMENEPVTCILYINSSYDLLIPDLAGTTATDRHNEGRIWKYGDGTFGFGFLQDNFIIDLKHIAPNGCLLH